LIKKKAAREDPAAWKVKVHKTVSQVHSNATDCKSFPRFEIRFFDRDASRPKFDISIILPENAPDDFKYLTAAIGEMQRNVAWATRRERLERARKI
jgi:hypothetical protein